MAFPNLTDIATTTIDSRSGVVGDNVTKNNGFLTYLQDRGNIKTISGGDNINEEISFAENSNAAWYSGLDTISTGDADVLSSAQYQWKQLAAAVVISGLDLMKNRSKEKILDLLDERIEVAENTLRNFVSVGLYSDGTGFGGKQLTGLDLAVPTDPTTGTYGGISRVNFTFWRSQIQDDSGAPTPTTIQARMNSLWAKCVRGEDVPDLILSGSTYWGAFINSLQTIQRFTDPTKAKLGFRSTEYMGSSVILDGGVGGAATDTLGTMYFLNTKYFRFRPHSDRNFVSLNPDQRVSINQDAMVTLIAWMGNVTGKGMQYCGRMIHH